MNNISLLLLFLSATFSALASVAIKYSDRIFKFQIFENILISKIPAIFLYGAGFILYSIALKYASVSKAYPIMVSFAVLQLIALGGYFGEELNAKIFIGAALIILGIFIINYK
ncbi:EamA family transporter [Pantoea sp. DY-15]|uniref:EamA family transporter n=1 Tax=Pantoea sp. DY-15 TaxID=2871489 RepID=UPI001C969F31|nr:EamA family transporter [Pantoea sp. DY-15]MBY4889240.1 EamA family transporter [Pantoea sp. DY-15]